MSNQLSGKYRMCDKELEETMQDEIMKELAVA